MPDFIKKLFGFIIDFIKGLFGSKKKSEESVQETAPKLETKTEAKVEAAEAEPAADQVEQAESPVAIAVPETQETQPSADDAKSSGKTFFLDADSAKTFGNIDYMRMAKATKKTLEKSDSQAANSATLAPEPQSIAEARQEASDRRLTDSSMDMFRNMARDLNSANQKKKK